MTRVAAITRLTEQEARARSEAVDADPLLDALTVDANETAPGEWSVTFYFEEEPSPAVLAALAAINGGKAPALADVPDTDWVAKSLEGLAPVRAGPFVVHGSHDRDKIRPNDIAIEIEASEAFGTGHHGTTAGCLIAIDALAGRRAIANALDLGTGSGVLAIALAKRARCKVVASDIDPVAAKIAAENAKLNGVAAHVRAVAANGFDHPEIAAAAPYDLIVANILAAPLVELAPSLRRHVAPGGHIILSGLLTSQRRQVTAAYVGRELKLERAIVMDEWVTLVLALPERQAR